MSFARGPNRRRGPPDGGKGGDGGSIYVIGVPSDKGLTLTKYHFAAGRGGNGRGRNMAGEKGDSVEIPLPIGTVVRDLGPAEVSEAHEEFDDENEEGNDDDDRYRAKEAVSSSEAACGGSSMVPHQGDADEEYRSELLAMQQRLGEALADAETCTEEREEFESMLQQLEQRLLELPRIRAPQGQNEEEEDDENEAAGGAAETERPEDAPILVDISEVGQRFCVVAGGRGGLGNFSFASGKNRSPQQRTPGRPGQTTRLTLELKTIADVGLVGYPNAGKSTLLAALSRASPKVASYPFTTLHPFVGTVAVPGLEHQGATYTVADIPGLVPGAHLNVGLGHDFLRHVERCSLLLYVIDCSIAAERGGAVETLETLLREVELYNADMGERPAAVLVNKIDQLCQSRLEELQQRTHTLGMPIFQASGRERTHIDGLKAGLYRLLHAGGGA